MKPFPIQTNTSSYQAPVKTRFSARHAKNKSHGLFQAVRHKLKTGHDLPKPMLRTFSSTRNPSTFSICTANISPSSSPCARLEIPSNIDNQTQTSSLTRICESSTPTTLEQKLEIKQLKAEIPYTSPQEKPTKAFIEQTLLRFLEQNLRYLESQRNTTPLQCHARAQLFCQNLEEKGYTPLKIWKFWETPWYDVDTDQHWKYHVSIGVEDANGEIWLLDPWWYKDAHLETTTGTVSVMSLEAWLNPTNEKRPVSFKITGAEQKFHDSGDNDDVYREMSMAIDMDNLNEIWQPW